MSARLNGHAAPLDKPISLAVHYAVVRERDELKERLRETYRSKCELEETLAAERAIYAADREFWRRLGKPDIPRTASDSACLHTAGEKA